MSLNAPRITNIDYPSEDDAAKVLQLLAANDILWDYQHPTDDVFSFSTDRSRIIAKRGVLKDILLTSEPCKPFLNHRATLLERTMALNRMSKLCRPTVELYTREGTSAEKQLAGTDYMRVVTFDTLMQGIESLYPGSTQEWVAMNNNSDDAWHKLSKAVKDYAANITIVGGSHIDSVSFHYKLNEVCVAKYRKVFEQALLKLANHPIGRQTVIAALCINQSILYDLPMELVITPRIHVEGKKRQGQDSYSSSHYLQLVPNILDYWPVLYHELNHLILGVCGLDRCLHYGIGTQLCQKLFRNDNYDEFKRKCNAVPGLVSKADTVQLPMDIVLGLCAEPYAFEGNNYLLPMLYDMFVVASHFSNEAEMVDIIGIMPHWMPGDRPQAKTSCLVINHLSDFNFLEQVRWGHGNPMILNTMLERIGYTLQSDSLSTEGRKWFENANYVLKEFRDLKDWTTLQPDPDAFKRLCQLHERDIDTKYIDDRVTTDVELYCESNVRKMDGWDPQRVC
ncbi:MAG: hypothetical protein MJ218_02465 [Opitutales bacterium]|nr:hypothetical protein [Opitutales bacterium]